MSDVVIQVEHLSKLYRIGRAQQRHDTLRDLIAGLGSRVADRFRPTPNPQSTIRDAQSEEYIWALKDVSFEVRRGEVLGIIGRNGAGKSTLLKILSRITEPTEGRAIVRGRVGSLLEVGTGFHPELTGRENIYLNGAILGMKKAEIDRKFDEIVAFAEIEKFLDTPVKRYSSGMYVRLAFAVAAHLEPEILLVDEVLAVGDAAFQKKCLGKMGQVAGEGRTVLFVSHNMAAVRKLCSYAILLDGGRKEATGSADAVISEYLTRGEASLSPVILLPFASEDVPGVATVLRIFAEDGTPRARFHLWEKWYMRLEFEIFKPVRHVIAAVGLLNFEGVSIITYWSRPKDLQPGRYCVTFRCDVPLKACDLNFAVGLSEHERTFYYVQGIGHIAIDEIAAGEQPFCASGAGLLLSRQECEIVLRDGYSATP
ncbi:MAG: polysaccharide ABC transporter ATP-binding protein [Anaerolineae bacterium]|nr:polysaccharide ABC transporter ATP-binding protein [Anaerolineae bacterium]